MAKGTEKQLPSSDYRLECELVPPGNLVVTRCDDSLAQRLGYAKVPRRDPWLRIIPPEDEERAREAIAVLGGGRTWEGRARMRTAEGATLTFHVVATAAHQNESSIVIHLDMRDVTEVAELEKALAERETRLRLLSEELGVAMWNTDEALRFTWSSGPAFERLGFQEDAMVGTSFYELFDTEDPAFPPIAAHHLALQGEAANYEVDWQDRRWRALVEPLRDPLGRIVGVLGVAVDLSIVMRVARISAEPIKTQMDPDPPVSSNGHGFERLTLADLTIDPEQFQVLKGKSEIALTVSEFKLLMEFARRPGRVLSRRLLAERVWGHEFYGDGASVTMAISRLRNKIEDNPNVPTIIQTVRGLGYRAAGEALDEA